MSFAFYLKDKDQETGPQQWAALFSSSELKGRPFLMQAESSHASMDFLLKIVPPADLSDLIFIPTTKWFRTKKNRQVLIIDCSNMNDGVAAGRFQIRRVSAETKGKHHVERVLIKTATRDLYDIQPDATLHPVNDADIKMVVLEFKMPGNSKTEEFQFFLNVVDTHSKLATPEEKDCDPQVGNDPPK